MKEKEFTKEYLKKLKNKWYWCFKIPDVWYTLKPCDIVAWKDWKLYWIEIKVWRVNTYERIYKKLRPNQVGSLYKIQQAWWKSLLVWYDTKDKKEYEYEFKLLDEVNNEL